MRLNKLKTPRPRATDAHPRGIRFPISLRPLGSPLGGVALAR